MRAEADGIAGNETFKRLSLKITQAEILGLKTCSNKKKVTKVIRWLTYKLRA